MQKKSLKISLVTLALVLGLVATPAAAYDYFPIENDSFWWTWARSDRPVQDGAVSRTWMWGPGAYTSAGYEVYVDSDGGERLVQYFDKSRMEINDFHADPNNPWYVTNGRLAYELLTGEMQIGDYEYLQYDPAHLSIAGDPHPDTPTYAIFGETMHERWYEPDDPYIDIEIVSDWIPYYGYISFEYYEELQEYGVGIGHYIWETDLVIADVFWDFMNSSGLIYGPSGMAYDSLFPNPYYATGFPITEPYWVWAPVAGEWQDVLVQCFERRCLSYTPGNPPGWQVEASNIGQHYFHWRYGD